MKHTYFMILCTIIISSCKEVKAVDPDAFIFLPEASYTIDSYNGVAVHRLEGSGKVMNGYYVIGNDFGKFEEFNVIDGILNGVSLTFHNNNEIYSKTNYVRGKKHGEESTYYRSGKLQKKSNYVNGVIVDKTQWFYETGQLQTESKIENELEIESTTYDILGNIVSQRFIEDSRTITQTIQNGKITSENIESNYDSFSAIKFYDSDGNMEVFIRMYDDGTDQFLIELDENENEIKRIDVKKNPKEALKYRSFLMNR